MRFCSNWNSCTLLIGVPFGIINYSNPVAESIKITDMHILSNSLSRYVVQSLSCVRLFATPWTATSQASCPSPSPWSLLKLMSVESVMPSNHLFLCHPLLSLPSIFPSIRDFSNESALCIRWPKYWSFSFSISPFSEYSGLISFRIDWFDLLAVPWTLKIFSSTTV